MKFLAERGPSGTSIPAPMADRVVRSICVFCGSRPGADPAFVTAGAEIGRAIAARGLTLVYGGARVGVMGAVADAALSAGGRVVGVIPKSLVSKEIAHDDRFTRELEIVDAFDRLLRCRGVVGRTHAQRPFATIKSVRSSIRAEKPDSLSYQVITFARVPSITVVRSRSTVEELRLPL